MRLIDAEAIGKRIVERARPLGSTAYHWLTEAVAMIANEPTVDAEPVRHGKWHVRPYDIICSACGKSFDYDYPADVCVQDYHYCPNCGAKMGGGEQHDIG